MSSLQPSHDLDLEPLFGSPIFFNHNPQFHDDDKILNDLMEYHQNHHHHHPSFIQSDSTLVNFTQPSSNCKKETKNRDAYGHRRVLHRDLERRRRQQMSDLYASLRSLLPFHLIKGKRSVCDHMDEAANYINQMKKNIQELQIRRDKLKNNSPNSVTVNLAGNGHVEILIICSSFTSTDNLGLSKVFMELLEREVSVVNCVSTKTKREFLHQIQAEASDVRSLDLAALQQRLNLAINYQLATFLAP